MRPKTELLREIVDYSEHPEIVDTAKKLYKLNQIDFKARMAELRHEYGNDSDALSESANTAYSNARSLCEILISKYSSLDQASAGYDENEGAEICAIYLETNNFGCFVLERERSLEGESYHLYFDNELLENFISELSPKDELAHVDELSYIYEPNFEGNLEDAAWIGLSYEHLLIVANDLVNPISSRDIRRYEASSDF